MKFVFKLFLTIACIYLIAAESNNKSNTDKNSKTKEEKANKSEQTPPAHVSEIFYGGNPNTLPKDRHFLWKDYQKNQFQRPYYHGVVGPQWRVPGAEVDGGPYKHIASPMPRQDYSSRIIPHDLPPITHTPSSFDMPLRKDVAQIDIPFAATHTKETYVDPRVPLKMPVGVVSGTIYHGTGNVDPLVTHALHNNQNPPIAQNHQTIDAVNKGLPLFVEKESKKEVKNENLRGKTSKAKQADSKLTKEIQQAKHVGIAETRRASAISGAMLDKMTRWPQGGHSDMILGIDLINKRDPDLRLYQDNPTLRSRIHELSEHPEGVRAMNSRRALPLVG